MANSTIKVNKSNITESGTITAESTAQVYDSAQVAVCGNVVKAYFMIRVPTKEYVGGWLARFSTNCYPSADRLVVGVEYSTGIPKTFKVAPSGYLSNFEAIAEETTFLFDITYLL